MLSPKRTKFRKMQTGRMKGLSQRGHALSNGMYGTKCEQEMCMFRNPINDLGPVNHILVGPFYVNKPPLNKISRGLPICICCISLKWS